MCSNYQPISKSRSGWVLEHFKIELPGEDYKSHIFHGGFGPFLFNLENNLHCEIGQFGLEPRWAEFIKDFHKFSYNSTEEHITERKTFKQAWKERRFCIILADTFLEPRYEHEGAKPVWTKIKRADGQPVAIAGIWERYAQKRDGQIKNSFSMVTQNCDSHPFLNLFHKPGKEKRTIVVLENHEMHDWLTASHERARELIKLTDVGLLVAD